MPWACRGLCAKLAVKIEDIRQSGGSQEAFSIPIYNFLSLIKLFKVDDHPESDTVDSPDTSWINNNNNNIDANTTITDIQPRNGPTSITTETADSYFDFDMEPDSPGSPVDECEYTRLIETSGSTPQEQQAPESGFVCASPSSINGDESRGSASSSDVQFFDPESSDTATEFFDCPPEHKSPRRYRFLSHNRVAMKPPSPIAASPSSSESSTTPTSKVNGHVRLLESGECDSSDSFPPSQQSTNSSLSTASKLNSNSNSNSTLQDTDGEIAVDEAGLEGHNDDGSEKFTAALYDVSKTKFVKYISPDEDEEKELSPEPQEKDAESEEVFDQDKVLEEITTIDVSEPVDDETALEEEPPTKKQADEEEYERLPRVRRCSSLKSGKTPPGTPGRKKIVRFADVLGLDLADVRTFLDEVPKIPKSAYEYLDITLPAQEIQLGPPLEKVLVPLFQQPGCLPGFIDRLRENQVVLESAAVTDPVCLTITGCVRVRNLDFHKSVHVRYSMDNWRSHSDLSATYVEGSCDGFSDKFSFIMFGNSLQIGQRLELAIRFQAKGEQFWDSNYGTNYSFQCLPCNTRSNSAIEAPIEMNLMLDENSCSASMQATAGTITIHTDAMGSQQWSNTFLY